MLNKTLTNGLLLSGFVLTGLIWSAPAIAQSALAQHTTAEQSTSQQSSKSSTAKPAKTAATKSAAAKKTPPKPLVYVKDDRTTAKADETKTDTSAKSAGDASVKKASQTSTSKIAPAVKTSSSAASEKPLSADVTKAFAQNCPSVALTSSKSKAAYEVTFEREPGSKGVKSAFGLRKASKIEVTSRSGKELFSENGHSTGQLVKDACTAMGTPGTKIAKN